jgi:hypothetical protein
MDTKAVKLLQLIGGILCNLSPPHLHTVLKMMSLNSKMNNQIYGKFDMKSFVQFMSNPHIETCF